MNKRKLVGLFTILGLIFPLLLSLGAAKPVFAAADQLVEINKRKFPSMPSDTQNTGQVIENFGGEPLEGAEFTAYDVTSVYWTTYEATSGKHDEKEAAALAAAKAVDTSKLTGTKFPITNGDGKSEKTLSTQSDGQNAIYLFVETKSPAGVVQSKSVPFVLGLPVHDEDGKILDKVYVYPKNEVKTNEIQFVKYGISPSGEKTGLQGANFVLKNGAGKYYDVTKNEFSFDDAESASKIVSGTGGIVNIKDLTLDPGTYEFYEVDSDVAAATGTKGTDEVFHYKNNPIVTVHVSKDMVVTYDYYNQNQVIQEGKDSAEAYNYKVPVPTKEVDDNDVDAGQIVEFTITQQIPYDINQYTKFELIDKYDSRLELVSKESEILGSLTIGGQAIANHGATYSVPEPQQFKLTFDVSKLVPHAGEMLEFKVKMQVKPGTDLSDIDNNIVFENDYFDKTGTETTKSYGKTFKKIDSNTENALAGAEFVIKNEDGEFMQLIEEKAPGEKTSVESVTGNAVGYEVKWVTEAEAKDATRLISGTDGVFGIYGLQSGDYTLVEVQAPGGYVTMADLTFTVDNGTLALNVINKTKGLLPSTGGMGVAAFILLGVTAISGAGIYFKKERS